MSDVTLRAMLCDLERGDDPVLCQLGGQLRHLGCCGSLDATVRTATYYKWVLRTADLIEQLEAKPQTETTQNLVGLFTCSLLRVTEQLYQEGLQGTRRPLAGVNFAELYGKYLKKRHAYLATQPA